jgi:hypothetical protein
MLQQEALLLFPVFESYLINVAPIKILHRGRKGSVLNDFTTIPLSGFPSHQPSEITSVSGIDV